MKVLFIVDHAPDYRESFFRQLGEKVDLTVVAQPCESEGLSAPDNRLGYRYIEIPAWCAGPFYWQPGLRTVLSYENWSLVCCDINLRHLSRILFFLTNVKLRARWIWRGHVFGRNQSRFLDELRKFLLHSGSSCLAYSEPIANEVRERYGVDAVSFNNTQVSEKEFGVGSFSRAHYEVRLLYVGRNQTRKKLDRLVKLAERCAYISIRLIGPRMDDLNVPEALLSSGQIQLIGRTVGEQLSLHFDWADLVVNPGHVGLLVMNAAKHGKGIVIDSNSEHAPEYWLAKESDQPFIAFDDKDEVDLFFEDLVRDRAKLVQWASQLQRVAREKYTIEHMVAVHCRVFGKVMNASAARLK